MVTTTCVVGLEKVQRTRRATMTMEKTFLHAVKGTRFAIFAREPQLERTSTIIEKFQIPFQSMATSQFIVTSTIDLNFGRRLTESRVVLFSLCRHQILLHSLCRHRDSLPNVYIGYCVEKDVYIGKRVEG